MRMEEPLMDGWGPRGTLRHVSDRCGGAGEPADDGEGPTLIRYIQWQSFYAASENNCANRLLVSADDGLGAAAAVGVTGPRRGRHPHRPRGPANKAARGTHLVKYGRTPSGGEWVHYTVRLAIMSIIYNMTKLLPRARLANNRPISLLYQYTTPLPYRLCCCPHMYVL